MLGTPTNKLYNICLLLRSILGLYCEFEEYELLAVDNDVLVCMHLMILQ